MGRGWVSGCWLVYPRFVRSPALPCEAAGVLAPRRLRIQPRTHRRHVVKLPDVDARPDRQLAAGDGQAHRLREIAKVRVQHAAVVPQDHQLARLVGRHQHARRAPRPGAAESCVVWTLRSGGSAAAAAAAWRRRSWRSAAIGTSAMTAMILAAGRGETRYWVRWFNASSVDR